MANQRENNVFTLMTLRGGLDDSPSIVGIAEDSCSVAENIEFVDSMLGERRKGCEAITQHGSFAALDAVTWLHRSLPILPEFNGEEAFVWGLAQSLTTTSYVLSILDGGSWSDVAPDDDIDVTEGRGHRISAQDLHGKTFFAYKSDEDRLHVFHNGFLRRVGLAQPAAPSVANFGAGTFATTRYYRVRYVHVDAVNSVVQAVSEPSETTTFVPSGAGSAARITKPATINERETHWDVEASLDNVDFYRIARVAVGTTTYDDTTAAGTGYATVGNTLSADIGAHTLPASCKFLSADEDRLLMASSWEDETLTSRVTWTPVYADPGDSNDERIELETDPFLDLDGFEGGQITGMSRNVNGYIYVFKKDHTYKLVRTNSRAKSYEAVCITKARGALIGSLVEAVDQEGQPTIYFLDPSVGPMRLGANGLQWCGRDVQTTWARVNTNAIVPCHGVYYPTRKQLHYWLAVDGSDYPNFKIVLHVNEMRNTEEGGRRGWVTVSKNSRIATAHCSVMAADNIDSVDTPTLNLVPYIGKEVWVVDGNTIFDQIQKCDTGGTDAHTVGDTASEYRGVVTTRPFIIAGLLNQHEVLAGAALVKTSDTPDGLVFFKVIKDYGKESKTVNTSFYTSGDETHLIAKLDDLNFSEMYALQVSIGDLDDNVTPPETWGVDMLQLKITDGNGT